MRIRKRRKNEENDAYRNSFTKNYIFLERNDDSNSGNTLCVWRTRYNIPATIYL